MRYKVFYYGGGNTERPGPINIITKNDGLKLSIGIKQFISYSDIQSVKIDYQVLEKEMSAGKAVVGGLLFGGVGALAGGALGGQKVKQFLKVKYTLESEEKELVLGTNIAEKLKKGIDKKIGLSPIKTTQRPDLLKYHKKFYGGSFNAAKSLIKSKKPKA